MPGLPPPPGVPPLDLTAIREARFTYPVPVNRGREVPYEELVAGKHYYLKTNSSSPMYEFRFLEHIPNHSFRAEYLPELRNVRNRAGNPLYSVYEPMPPHPAGAPPIYEQHAWPHYKFYEVSKIKRQGRFINPNITKKSKRQAVVNALNRRRLSTAAGTGPTNTILKFVGLQPPKKAKGGMYRNSSYSVEMALRKTRVRGTKRSRKAHKTRKQRGGADAKRLAVNLRKAAALAKPEEGQPQGSSNLYYAPVEGILDEGYGLIIGPRIATEGDVTLRNAVYPYEECIVLFHFKMGDEYPAAPPKVHHLTAGIFGTTNYRIHPNLYEVYADPSTSQKTCLGILGTWGANEWKSTMGPADVLQGIMGILEADPGTYEPGQQHSLKSPNPGGIAYNQHTFAECVEITCAIYKAVLTAVSADATPNSITISENNIKRAKIPKEIAPFVDNLALRAYSGLGFLIGKTEEFIRVNGGNPILDLTTNYVMHKRSRQIDFGKLLKCLKEAREMVPIGLRKNIFKYGLGEIHRALYNLSKPKWPNGKPKTYEEFVEEIEARNRAPAPAAAAAAAANNENETQYVYSNNENNLPPEFETLEDE